MSENQVPPFVIRTDSYLLVLILNDEMHDMLEKIEMERGDLIPADVKICKPL